jgi:hypothetical protein
VTDPIAVARPLLTALKTPQHLADFDLDRWDLLVRQARRTKLLSRIAVQVIGLGLIDRLPQKVAETLRAAAYVAADNRRMIAWETNRIRRALADIDVPVMLLKGAAYVAAELPPADGRIAGDIDIMVPASRLADVEAALEKHGWRPITFLDYDQRYYRKWMHELPPLRHEDRETVIDVHHTILPRTSRLKPDPDKLWQQARDLSGGDMKILGPQDMVLHGAAHLFQDGDLVFAIRDLVDLADLFDHFGREPGFWETLVERAGEHQLQRPLYYALRYGRSLLDLVVPDAIERAIAPAAPPKPIVNMMDRVMPRVLLPGHPDQPSRERRRAAVLLYMRSHWLRMPPWLLAAHLTRKTTMQFAAAILRWHEKRKERREQAG